MISPELMDRSIRPRLKARDEVFVADLLARLRERGVFIHRYKARCINGKVRKDKWQMAAVQYWLDGSATVNLVDVPVELAQEVVACGLGTVRAV
jgi:hypothetical protein